MKVVGNGAQRRRLWLFVIAAGGCGDVGAGSWWRAGRLSLDSRRWLWFLVSGVMAEGWAMAVGVGGLLKWLDTFA